MKSKNIFCMLNVGKGGTHYERALYDSNFFSKCSKSSRTLICTQEKCHEKSNFDEVSEVYEKNHSDGTVMMHPSETRREKNPILRFIIDIFFIDLKTL